MDIGVIAASMFDALRYAEACYLGNWEIQHIAVCLGPDIPTIYASRGTYLYWETAKVEQVGPMPPLNNIVTAICVSGVDPNPLLRAYFG